jgi:uncharacterized membrane protein
MSAKFKVYLTAAVIHLAAMTAVIAGLPDRVPIHFNYAGEADWWGGKWTYVLFACIPLLELGSYVLYRRFSKNPNVQKNAAMEERTVAYTGLLLAAIGWLILMLVRSGESRLSPSYFCLIFTGVGLLMIFVSNFMAKIRPNHSMGFRVSWTLRDETVWVKTHRVAGYTGVLGGAVIVAGSLVGMAIEPWMAFAGFGLGMIVMVLTPAIYARNLYHQLHPGE